MDAADATIVPQQPTSILQQHHAGRPVWPVERPLSRAPGERRAPSVRLKGSDQVLAAVASCRNGGAWRVAGRRAAAQWPASAAPPDEMATGSTVSSSLRMARTCWVRGGALRPQCSALCGNRPARSSWAARRPKPLTNVIGSPSVTFVSAQITFHMKDRFPMFNTMD